MLKVRVWATLLFVAIGLLGGGGRAFAQEGEGDNPDDAFIEITAYICANSDRAGEVDFYVASVSASDQGICRLAAENEFDFTLISEADGELETRSTTPIGLAAFEAAAPDTLTVREDFSITSTESFSVAQGDYVSVTYIQNTLDEGNFGPEGGTSQFWIEHKICEDAELADTTAFFVGNSFVQIADDSLSCVFGVSSAFVLSPITVIDVGEVESAGVVNDVTLTTDEGGLTDTETVAAGTYTVTEVSNGAISPQLNVIGDNTVVVTVIDYVEPAVEPEPPADGAASLTIHKAVCETGAGADIFEECHDDAVEDVTFWVNDVEWTTDEDGVAAGEVAEGDVVIAEDEATFDDYGGYVYCSEQGSGDVLIDTDTQDGVKTLPATGVGVTAPDSGSLAFLLIGMMSVVAVAGLSGLRQNRS